MTSANDKPRAPISLCVIARDAPLLEQALRSARDHVAQIVVVTNGTAPLSDAAMAMIDVFEVFLECNDPDTGLIDDFAMAREHAFSRATEPWVMWMDADDELVDGHNLLPLIQAAATAHPNTPVEFMFPYEYSYDAAGHCTTEHFRERLFYRYHAAFHWQNPVHEVVIPKPGANFVQLRSRNVIWKHRSRGGGESGRNLRILRKWVANHGTDDARTLYYLGSECQDNGHREEAIEYLTKYIGLSGWDDERVMACLRLVKLNDQDPGEAMRWAFQAISLQENWAEGYFALARIFYFIAVKGGPNVQRYWQRCVHFARMGLERPSTNTVLFVNPMERAEIHQYLNVALNNLGDVPGALASTEAGLSIQPDNGNLEFNRRLYASNITRERVRVGIALLLAHGPAGGGLTPELANVAQSAIDGNAHASASWPDFRRPAAYPRDVTAADFPVARPTPHPQAWGIPEVFELQGLPLRMSPAQLESVTLALWHEYMLHDELVSAIALLKDAPFRIKHSHRIAAALKLTEQTIAWMQDLETAQRVNSPEQPDIENGAPLPQPLSGAVGGRFDLIVAALHKGERVLDLGCFDGALTNRMGLLGFVVDGIDLCGRSVALANRKAEEFGTNARHFVGYFHELGDILVEKYDVVTCCDTYEHVLDPVKDLLRPAVYYALKKTGRVVIVTPYGSWMRGEFVPWAHPWRWAPDLGKAWICDEARAHVVAPTPWTVAANLARAGLRVHNSYVVPCGPTRDIEGQANVFADAYVDTLARQVTYPAEGRDLDIAIVCGAAWEPWNPRTAREHGIGGSETAVIEMSKELVARGCRVRVYTDCGDVGEGIYDGAEFYDTSKLPVAEPCDVLVAWRNARHLESMEANVKLLWVHDIYAMQATNSLLLKADRVMGLSAWHCSYLRQIHNLTAEHVYQTRNGIDLARFSHHVERHPHRVVYSSSPDRGLQALLQMWPRIRERVPDAELRVFYGFDNWIKMAGGDESQLRVIELLKKMLDDLAPMGVMQCGRANQQQLANEMMASGALLYPTWFTETNFITGYESQAAGLRIVTSPIAALNETVGDRGVLIPGDWLAPDYQDRFVEAAVEALLKPDDGDRAMLEEYARDHFSWGAVAEDWIQLAQGLLESKATRPLVPYIPARGFMRVDTGHWDQERGMPAGPRAPFVESSP